MAIRESRSPDTGGCEFCGWCGDTIDVTLVDRSGGAFLRVCPTCWNRMVAPRCAVCGDRQESPECSLVNSDPSVDATETPPVCSECRGRLLSDETEVSLS